MVPKLSAFYFSHVLPELAVPRYRTVTGIRKPPIPWVKFCYIISFPKQYAQAHLDTFKCKNNYNEDAKG